LTSGAALSFGLAHFGSSEFELMAEELLMSDSVIKVSRIIRQYISWNNSTLFTWIMLLLLSFHFLSETIFYKPKQSKFLISPNRERHQHYFMFYYLYGLVILRRKKIPFHVLLPFPFFLM
jgi:hypothetical protein